MSIWKSQETKLRRQSQTCKTFEIKIDTSHLSQSKLEHLHKLFLEAKWLYNDILSQNIFTYDTKPNKVIVLNKDKIKEERNIMFLSSQMKQAVKERLQYAVKALAAKKKKQVTKKKKQRIGKIKFTSNVQSIVLNQYNVTYRFLENGKYLKLQGCKYKFKINGHNQIPDNAEITNATLCHRHNDFYLKVTCFFPKEENVYSEDAIGIDFGLKTTLTLSSGEKLNLKYPENKRLRRSSRRLKKRTKGSKNYIKMKDQTNKEYHKLTNRKKDKKNKIVSYISKKYKTVICQDENIVGWHHGLYGKSVQHSLMGGIMRDLQRKSHTFIKVDRFFPSTQLCPNCGKKNKLELDERTYVCICGYIEDRDTKSAICILNEGLRIRDSQSNNKQIHTEHMEYTPVEILPLHFNICSANAEMQVMSLKQEAPTFR